MAGAIVIALAALFRDRVPFRSPVFTLEALNALRDVHSGRVSDYVTWLTLGVGGMGVLLAFLLT
jgi:hypothetical protein